MAFLLWSHDFSLSPILLCPILPLMDLIITEKKPISVAYKNHKEEELWSEGGDRRETTAPGDWQHTWGEATGVWMLLKLWFLQEIYSCLNQ